VTLRWQSLSQDFSSKGWNLHATLSGNRVHLARGQRQGSTWQTCRSVIHPREHLVLNSPGPTWGRCQKGRRLNYMGGAEKPGYRSGVAICTSRDEQPSEREHSPPWIPFADLRPCGERLIFNNCVYNLNSSHVKGAIDYTLRIVVWFMIIKLGNSFLFANIISFRISLNQIRLLISARLRDLIPSVW